MAMKFCIPQQAVEEFKRQLKSRKIVPMKLAELTSTERRDVFNDIFKNDHTAMKVNALYESKLLLKDQQRGMITWIKNVIGESTPTSREMIDRVGRLEDPLSATEETFFYHDLIEQRLGLDISMQEAGKLVQMSNEVRDKFDKIDRNSEDRSESRIAYGEAKVAFDEYVKALKLREATNLSESAKQYYAKVRANPGKVILDLSGSSKVIIASIDQSFYGRQGLMTFYTSPKIWMKNYGKSLNEFQQFFGKKENVLRLSQIDIFSRENFLNGKYKALQLDVGVSAEEAFPTPLPEKIPLIGAGYKFSSQAYTAAAIRFRADLADLYLEQMEANGIDTLKDENLPVVGEYIGMMTGRSRGRYLTAKGAKVVNAMLFSPKYVLSQIRMIVEPVAAMGSYAQKIATGQSLKAKTALDFKHQKAMVNFMKYMAMVYATMFVASMFDEDSVEWDWRSANFGKIMLGENHDIKVSLMGGFNAVLTLFARLVTQSYKTGRGDIESIWEDGYGKKAGADFLLGFFLNKVTPVVSLFTNYFLRGGKDFKGERPTALEQAKRMTFPINLQNIGALMKKRENVDILTLPFLIYASNLGVLTVYDEKKKTRRRF